MSFCWTPETLRAARRLYLDEGLSASETARRLGTTRSSLIGKAHRMGWAEERDPALAAANMVRGGRTLAKTLRAARPADRPRRRAPAGSQPTASDAKSWQAKPWMERRPGECAFPVSGDGGAVASCCAPCGLRGYCEDHLAVMFIRRSAKQQKALERVAEWVDQVESRLPASGVAR